jgi:hypothetical protein
MMLTLEPGDEVLEDEPFTSPANFKRAHRRLQKALIEIAMSDEGDTWPAWYREWVIGTARCQLAMMALDVLQGGG